MTEDYVVSKIHEALKATGDDKRDAQKLLITWAVRDQTLLLGLAKPHLRALISARIEEVCRAGRKKKGEGGPDRLDVSMIEQTKGEKRHVVKVPPPKTSERQASVMHHLAAAFKRKKG